MRKLRVIFTTVGGAMPALLAAIVAPATDACGGSIDYGVIDGSSSDGGRADVEPTPGFGGSPPVPEWDGAPSCPTYIVEIPPPGTAAEPGQLCAVPSPATSNVAARVTLTAYSPQLRTAVGVIEVAAEVASTIVDLPTIAVRDASASELAAITVSDMTKTEDGYRFRVEWPAGAPTWPGANIVIATTFTIACSDGGTQTVEALTKLDLCQGSDSADYAWVSSGDACTVCHVIAEMAPSPIVSDKKGDDLPLGMVIRLRVVEVARAGRQILLFADNDAGPSAEYEWRVSEGAIEHIAPDVVLWTLPDEGSAGRRSAPFGQVAVWNDAGAAVENFIFSVAWQEAA